MKTFSELTLIEPLQRALAELNYETPTPIQAKTIPHAIDGTDVLGCAQTGTGKTAAFALPILDFLGGDKRRAQSGKPQALVLAPTRELAIQIGDSFKTYGKHVKLRTVLVFGGVNQHRQVKAMKSGAHVLVATPGRLLDLMQQGHIDLGSLEVFVLDEADRMLDMGFLPDLKKIIRSLPDERQSLFFSATMSAKVTALAKELLFNPVSINVTPKRTSVKTIDQKLIFVEKGEKPKLLCGILNGDGVERAIVFTRTKRGADSVARKLEKAGLAAAVIHGNKSQNSRQRALDAFRRNKVRIMVATDVAARGIDIDNITHVINYDLPNEPEAYVHRIGRTGRAGADGIAISFCGGEDIDVLPAIEKLIGNPIPRDPDQVEPRRIERKKPVRGDRRRPNAGGPSNSRKRQFKSKSGRGRSRSKARAST